MASQLMLFEIAQEKRADGTFLITPKRVHEDKEISVRAAMKLLGYRTRRKLYALLDSGAIKGWKGESERGNAHWKIYHSSVVAYKVNNSN